MKIDLSTCVETLKKIDNVLILMHHFPDGDTLGCGFGLCRALQKMGKNAKTLCADLISDRYDYIVQSVEQQDFMPDYIIAVDVADEKLLGSIKDEFSGKIDLCIDHHATNTCYAKKTFVDSSSAAACEIIYEIINQLGVEIDEQLASTLYTGIATDTGCFKFNNTSAVTHLIAASLIEKGADYGNINRLMFDTKTKSRVLVEQNVLNNIEFSHCDKIATVVLSQDMIVSSGAEDSELEGITSLPRTIEGVIVGITLREKKDGSYKISVRSHAPISASELCSAFGGGGHDAAAGCELKLPLDDAKKMLVEKADEMLTNCGI